MLDMKRKDKNRIYLAHMEKRINAKSFIPVSKL